MKTQQAFSAGGCAYRQEKGQTVWLLGKHSGYHKWVLPKGMIEEGETAKETAVRETVEEIGVVVEIEGDEPIFVDEYTFQAQIKKNIQEGPTDESGQPIRRVKAYQENKEFDKTSHETVTIHKTVSFYLMRYVSGEPGDHGWEMEDAGWFSFEEAMEILSFEGEKLALQAAHDKIQVL